MARSKPNEFDDLAGELYDLTKVDWSVMASCVITEPVCWVISIAPDGSNDDGIIFPQLNDFIGTGNIAETISLGIDKLIEMIKAQAQDV
jgi:hypothetical protein